MGTAEADQAEKPAEEKTEKAEQKPAKKEESVPPPAFSPWIFVALFAALVFSAAQQADLGSPEGIQAYYKELTGPHVVLPPKASKNEVVIQFCQS